CDLDYPTQLHDRYNYYPLALKSIAVDADMLSRYCVELLTTLSKKASPKTNNLIPNLRDKSKYVVHIRNLKFYLKMGLKIAYIHRVLKFRQSPWLAEYINFNTEMRKAATSTFEKDFYKLMNNSMFGKTMEN